MKFFAHFLKKYLNVKSSTRDYIFALQGENLYTMEKFVFSHCICISLFFYIFVPFCYTTATTTNIFFLLACAYLAFIFTIFFVFLHQIFILFSFFSHLFPFLSVASLSCIFIYLKHYSKAKFNIKKISPCFDNILSISFLSHFCIR